MLTKLIFFLILFSSSLISKSVGFLSRLSFSRDASTATVTDIREHLQHILRCVVCGSVVKNSIQHVWYHVIISSRNILFHIGDFVVEPLSGCQIFLLPAPWTRNVTPICSFSFLLSLSLNTRKVSATWLHSLPVTCRISFRSLRTFLFNLSPCFAESDP